MRKAVILFIFLCIFFLFTFDVTVALNNEELEKIKFKELLVQNVISVGAGSPALLVKIILSP